MITFANKQELLNAHEDIGRPLGDVIIGDLNEVEQELLAEKLSQELSVLKIRCRICSHEETTIVPTVADLSNLECRNCEKMTCQEIDETEWWQNTE